MKNGLIKKIFKLKKIILLFVLMAGLVSCSSDSEDNKEPEVTYADVKPTQTKYKAYYGQKLVKTGGVTSKSTETSPGSEIIKPISVIYYPRTYTLSFSNIFDVTTVEYPVSVIANNLENIIYTFNAKGVKGTFKINIKDLKPVNAVVTFENVVYTFDITVAESKNLAKLLVKDVNTSPNPASNFSREHIYVDTLLISSTYRYKDPNTLEDIVRYTEYLYDGAKLKGKNTIDENGVILSKMMYTYTNNLISKATITKPDGVTITGITLYEYDSNKRISAVKFANSQMIVNLARYYTYSKNTMNVKYTGKNDEVIENEVCTFDDQRKNFFYSQDQYLEPFSYLPITHTVSTTVDGQVYTYPDTSYEYSSDGLLIKSVSENDIRTREYREE